MLISKTVTLDSDDILQAMKLYVGAKLGVPAADICNFKIEGPATNLRIDVQLQQEIIKP